MATDIQTHAFAPRHPWKLVAYWTVSSLAIAILAFAAGLTWWFGGVLMSGPVGFNLSLAVAGLGLVLVALTEFRTPRRRDASFVVWAGILGMLYALATWTAVSA
jgi:hypothetical protein